MLDHETRAIDRALPEIVATTRVPNELAAVIAQQRKQIAPVIRQWSGGEAGGRAREPVRRDVQRKVARRGPTRHDPVLDQQQRHEFGDHLHKSGEIGAVRDKARNFVRCGNPHAPLLVPRGFNGDGERFSHAAHMRRARANGKTAQFTGDLLR